jgi:hypothetical protein
MGALTYPEKEREKTRERERERKRKNTRPRERERAGGCELCCFKSRQIDTPPKKEGGQL